MRKALDFGGLLLDPLLTLLLAAYSCAIKTYMMHNDPARYSWYNIWSAAAAVIAICVARGKNGKAFMDGTIMERLSLWEILLIRNVAAGTEMRVIVVKPGVPPSLMDNSTVVLHPPSLTLNSTTSDVANY